jgi:hypothetical protein
MVIYLAVFPIGNYRISKPVQIVNYFASSCCHFTFQLPVSFNFVTCVINNAGFQILAFMTLL